MLPRLGCRSSVLNQIWTVQKCRISIIINQGVLWKGRGRFLVQRFSFREMWQCFSPVLSAPASRQAVLSQSFRTDPLYPSWRQEIEDAFSFCLSSQQFFSEEAVISHYTWSQGSRDPSLCSQFCFSLSPPLVSLAQPLAPKHPWNWAERSSVYIQPHLSQARNCLIPVREVNNKGIFLPNKRSPNVSVIWAVPSLMNQLSLLKTSYSSRPWLFIFVGVFFVTLAVSILVCLDDLTIIVGLLFQRQHFRASNSLISLKIEVLCYL